MADRTSSARVLWIIGGALVAILLTLRLIAVVRERGSLAPDPLDVILIGIAVTIAVIVVIFGVIKLQIRGTTAALRRQQPDSIVRAIALRAEDIEPLRKVGVRVPKPMYAAIALGPNACSWWIGRRKARTLGEVVSDGGIEYSIGTYTHAGFPQTNLAAEFSLGGRRMTLPLVLVREQGLFLRRPSDGELEALVTRLGPQ